MTLVKSLALCYNPAPLCRLNLNYTGVRFPLPAKFDRGQIRGKEKYG